MDDRKVSKKKKLLVILIVIAVVLLIGLISLIFIPKIKLNGPETMKIKLNDKYVEKGAITVINGKQISKKVDISGKIDTSKPGKYVIKYSIKTGFLKDIKERTVEVIDDISPVIELVGNKEVTICKNAQYKEEGYTASDNYDGDLSEKVTVKEVEDGIEYTVFDSSNNTFTVKRTIKKEDNEKPKLSLVGPSIKYLMVNSSYVEQGVEVSDNCDSDIKNNVKITGNVDNKKAGTYKITYQVTDSSGNSSQVERKVIVYNRSNDIGGVGTTKTIYLTFDDGPSKTITPGILKILNEKGVKATFFVINHSSDLDYLIRQEFTSGHTVALHSYTHDYKTIYSSSDAYFNDLKKISDKVKSITGEESKIIRFPGGGSNTVSRNYSKGIMTYLTNEVISRGYHYFDWNVSCGDAGGASTKEQIYKNVINGLSPSRANIVLMHDFENNYKTLNALSDIIDYGYANGYRFMAIDMTTPLVRHKVNN